MFLSPWITTLLLGVLFSPIFLLAVKCYIGVLTFFGRKLGHVGFYKKATIIIVYCLFAPIIIVPFYFISILEGVVPLMKDDFVFLIWVLLWILVSYLPGIFYYNKKIPELKMFGKSQEFE